MRWAGHVARRRERRSLYKVLVGKSEENRTLEIPRHRWKDNIKMGPQKVGCGICRSIWLRTGTGGRLL